MSNKPVFKLTGVTLYWASLYDTNKMSGKYQVDLCNLTEAQVKRLEEENVKVRNLNDDRGFFVTSKSAKYPINAYNTSGDELKGVKAANGSKADVLVGTYDWKSPTGLKGTSLSVKKLIITDLIEYMPKGDDDFDDDIDVL